MNYPFHRFSIKNIAFRKRCKIFLLFGDVFFPVVFSYFAPKAFPPCPGLNSRHERDWYGIEPSGKPYLESGREKISFFCPQLSAHDEVFTKYSIQSFSFTSYKVMAPSNLFGGTKGCHYNISFNSRKLMSLLLPT